MKFVNDVVELIRSNMTCGDAELEKHAATLLGPRTRGSTTTKGLEDADPGCELEKLDSKNLEPGCELFVAFLPEMHGMLGAVALEDALFMNLPVSIRDGEHGKELFVDRDKQDVPNTPSSNIRIITGMHNGIPAVFTWHPGQILKPFCGILEADTAVKLHNG